MAQTEYDIAVVGAGIIGLAHAYLAAKAGRSVIVFERNPRALGASIRNFGMIWPIAQPPGKLRSLALRSREIWLEILQEAGLVHRATGSLHAAYRADEASVGMEFASRAEGLGYDCNWLGPEEAANKSPALNPNGLLGALWSPTELTVDPRLIMEALPAFLAERYDVHFSFNTAVQEVNIPTIRAGSQTYQAQAVVLACGDDYQTLFPDFLAALPLSRCKLQMMRTVPQPKDWQLGPALAFGLSFRHYAAFQICDALPALTARIAAETPQFDHWGIHVMISATADGALTLGDSHQYGTVVDIFDRAEINDLILNYLRERTCIPDFRIEQLWHGVYAKHPSESYIRYSPAPEVQGVIVTSGLGMTLSFGLAEETLALVAGS